MRGSLLLSFINSLVRAFEAQNATYAADWFSSITSDLFPSTLVTGCEETGQLAVTNNDMDVSLDLVVVAPHCRNLS